MHKSLKIILSAAALATIAAPAAAQVRGDEPVAVPRAIKQGIDFVYVDPQLSTIAVKKQRPRNWLTRIFRGREEAQNREPNPVFAQLADGLDQYEASWGRLPQVKIPAGATLKYGATGKRVELLRTRLGLPPAGGYDPALTERVSQYQEVHGLTPVDGIAGKGTLASLNLGADHFERRIAINMERAYRLPTTGTFERYVVVDSGAADAYVFQGDRIVDSMRVVVGTAKTKTPMMAVIMRNAKANPYWNVPPDLIRSLTARNVLKQGLGYLDNFHYEVLNDWTVTALPTDPKTINWKQVASGAREIRVRQLPGPWNSMGAMKFEMPNDYGIYLHDTPHKELFAQAERHLSNGCVRLEDYRRFAGWVFGNMPQPSSPREQNFALPKPVPVYMTYLTVEPDPANGVKFRPDVYGFDTLAMPQMFDGRQVALAS